MAEQEPPAVAAETIARESSRPLARPRRHPLIRLFQLLALGAVASLLGLLVWRVVASQRGPDLVKAIRHGERPQAPAFVLPIIWQSGGTWPRRLRPLLTGDKLALASLRGYPVVLNFWASWCVPCKAEAPLLASSAEQHAGTVAFLGVDVQDLSSDARRFLRRYHARYPSVHDNGGATYDGYGLTGVPETYWLDARGRIVAHYAGQVSKTLLEDGIRQAKGQR